MEGFGHWILLFSVFLIPGCGGSKEVMVPARSAAGAYGMRLRSDVFTFTVIPTVPEYASLDLLGLPHLTRYIRFEAQEEQGANIPLGSINFRAVEKSVVNNQEQSLDQPPSNAQGPYILHLGSKLEVTVDKKQRPYKISVHNGCQ